MQTPNRKQNTPPLCPFSLLQLNLPQNRTSALNWQNYNGLDKVAKFKSNFRAFALFFFLVWILQKQKLVRGGKHERRQKHRCGECPLYRNFENDDVVRSCSLKYHDAFNTHNKRMIRNFTLGSNSYPQEHTWNMHPESFLLVYKRTHMCAFNV